MLDRETLRSIAARVTGMRDRERFLIASLLAAQPDDALTDYRIALVEGLIIRTTTRSY